MTHALQDKVAIVTGASSGIGRATAKLFAREGASLVVAARSAQPLRDLVAEIAADGGRATACIGDVRDEDFARRMVDTAREAYGGLDIAFNNAGALGQMAPTPQVTREGWNEAIESNLTAAFLCAKHQLPAMVERGGGSLIFTSSFVGHTASFPGVAAYAASKAGLIGLTQTLAVEFGAQGVRVNALLPGATDTPMYREMIDTPQAREFIASLYALKRIATPEEMARSVLYLASDASTFTTGTAFAVEGGVSINRS
ncbi:SDR family oxidoreductase [Luteimonas sp. SX5]|uniref:SDR family oxidoreductase n=1 Tax=Luteimonas galliterrae TaxID=2940486 RepID=A0ABT0MIR0_9GAMM|nr:SDR family oxidoreductase [Luteimonas galliterrae]MCL1634761.1 SDR family oxidoreductase [Luteimonas galliterrae]